MSLFIVIFLKDNLFKKNNVLFFIVFGLEFSIINSILE
jgi:hypothetical protein